MYNRASIPRTALDMYCNRSNQIPISGSILVSVNPYRMFDSLYGLDAVSRYDGQIIGTLPPHLFAVGASAYHRMLAKDGEKQVSLDNDLEDDVPMQRCRWEAKYVCDGPHISAA
jgi:hypothetical protein